MSQDGMIIVTNDNDNITYVGDWNIVQASTVDSLVNSINGQPFSPSLHRTTTTSSFIFPYKGSSISVIGTIDTAQSKHDPSWVCAINGIPIDTSSVSPVNNENMQTLCQQEEISDGAHELVMNVTSKGTPFYLDILRYSPSPDVSLDNSLILIENNDSRVDFISGWKPLGIRNGTTDPEGLVNVTFIGVQLAWYGYIPFSNPHTNVSSGEFSVDNQPSTSFKIPGLQNSFSSTAFNQLLFTTPMLKMGNHVLSAKYTGKPGQSPFTFEYLIVTNGSSPSDTGAKPTSSSSGAHENSTSTPTPSISNTNTSPSHVGSIVGGVVGAVGGIAICSILLFFWLKFCKRRRTNSYNEVIRRGVGEPLSPSPQFYQAAPLLEFEFESRPTPAVDQISYEPTNATYQPSRFSTNRASQQLTATSYMTTSSSDEEVSVTDVSIDRSGESLPSPPQPRSIPSPLLRKGPATIGGGDILATFR